jgi:hypothetical protein
MSDSDKPNVPESVYDGYDDEGSGDAAKALLVGVLGGLASAAAYLIYRRLPDEHRDRLNNQVRSLVESRINEIRSNLNI